MLVGLAAAVVAAVLVYFVGILALHGLKERELRAFPKGYLLVKAAKKLHFKL